VQHSIKVNIQQNRGYWLCLC